MICSLSVSGNKNNRQQERNVDSSSTNTIIGGAIGGFSFMALILILVLVLLRRHYKLPLKQPPAVLYAVVVCMYCVYVTVKA